MLLLATDTSGRNGSIALAQCSPEDACQVLEVVPLEGGTFSAQLVPQIAALLSKHGFNKQDIGGFAVASGPGSFTGLRVGLAAIKALSEVLNKPIAAVSLLEAVAVSARQTGSLWAALDAGRREIYVGEYLLNDTANMQSERLLTSEEFVEAADGHRVITPDQTILEIARAAKLNAVEVERPNSGLISHLGWQKIRAGEIISPDALEANYIRRSDAEIFAKK